MSDQVASDQVAVDLSPANAVPTAANPYPVPVPDIQIYRAAFEVERFEMPYVCAELRRVAQEGISKTTNRVIDSATSGKNVVMVTSCHRMEGRTTCSLWLASELAARGQAVVVVDANLENPNLATMVGISPQSGWNDEAVVPVTDFMIESLEDSFTIMPLAADGPEQTDPAGSKLPSILESVRDGFDIVLVDAMPLEARGSVDLLKSIGPFVDSAILLHDHTGDASEDLSHLLGHLMSSGIDPLGLIYNNLPAQQKIA
ncbi:MAG: hypothetical protein N2C12_08575 [Planctomycetales bacterium]